MKSPGAGTMLDATTSRRRENVPPGSRVCSENALRRILYI